MTVDTGRWRYFPGNTNKVIVSPIIPTALHRDVVKLNVHTELGGRTRWADPKIRKNPCPEMSRLASRRM